MSTLRGRLWQLVLVMSALTFCHVAFADDAGGSITLAVPNVLPSGWAGVVLVSLAFAGYLLRRFSGVAAFHTKGGAVVITVLNVVISTALQTVQARGLDWRAIETAILSAFLTLAMMDNPSNTAAEQHAKVLGMKSKSGLPPAGPPITKVGVLLPLAFIVMAFAGCPATTAGQAAGKATVACELGQLPQTEQAVVAEAAALLAAGGAGWQDDLSALGKKLLPGQFSCLLQAILAAWTAPKGELTVERRAAIERLQIYLNAHPAPSACRPLPHCAPLRALATPVQPRG